MSESLAELASRLPEFQDKLLEHLLILTLVPVLMAVAIGIPAAIFARGNNLCRNLVITGSSIVQTIPSLAMLALMLPLFGIGKTPAIIALTLYALLPIIQNTLTGLDGVAKNILEAADGLGFSPRQRLGRVELPLALPVILSGIRTATVICVGVATLSTFIGAGGLGDFISRGLMLRKVPLLLFGAVGAALLAIYLDQILETLGRLLKPGRKTQPYRARLITLITIGFILIGLTTLRTSNGDRSKPAIRIGTKNFSEQIILGELMTQIIESHTALSVKRVFNLGGTIICHEALARGEIDLYAEYTGTALTAIMKQTVDNLPDRKKVRTLVNQAYVDTFNCRWLAPFGFDNTYTIAVRQTVAEQRGWRKISDLRYPSAKLSAGFTAEFMEREDGYPGLAKKYGFEFGRVRDLSPELMYLAAAEGKVDVICGFATDGRIKSFDLVTLEDDLGFFPPYEAAPVIRVETLRVHPEIEPVLLLLADKIDDPTMRRLNHEVDVNRRSPREVATEFLSEQKLLK